MCLGFDICGWDSMLAEIVSAWMRLHHRRRMTVVVVKELFHEGEAKKFGRTCWVAVR
jgi:hypothetical protein